MLTVATSSFETTEAQQLFCLLRRVKQHKPTDASLQLATLIKKKLVQNNSQVLISMTFDLSLNQVRCGAKNTTQPEILSSADGTSDCLAERTTGTREIRPLCLRSGISLATLGLFQRRVNRRQMPANALEGS